MGLKRPARRSDGLPLWSWTRGNPFPIRRVGRWLRVKGATPPGFALASRADRRNAARADHSLGAWKLPKYHLISRQTGAVVVPFPFIDTSKLK